MKSISSLVLVAATLFIAGSSADNLPSQGCFSSTVGLTIENATDTYNSKGSCSLACINLNKPVFAMTNRFSCYCGSDLPPANSKVDNSSCTTPCPGYPSDTCGGGSQYTSVYLTSDNLEGTISNSNSDGSAPSATSKTSPSTTPSATQSVVTIGGQTVVVTASASPSATGGSGGGASKAGVAAGVVVGLIALAAIAGGMFLFIRNKQRREVEEEYRRNAVISSFTNGRDKHPTSSAGDSSFSDMRLDPAVMAQRRMSDGSIADNQDYSRRILKVIHPSQPFRWASY
jgi:cell wall integrity and stress response component